MQNIYGDAGVSTGNGHAEADPLAERVEWAKNNLGGVLAKVETFVRERPGAALAIALGAGFIIGRIVRRS